MPEAEFDPEGEPSPPWHERAFAVAYVTVPLWRFLGFMAGMVPAAFLWPREGFTRRVQGFALIAVGTLVIASLVRAAGAARIAANQAKRRAEQESGR